jgi:hypothetical protein
METPINTVRELAFRVVHDKALEEQIKSNPAEALQAIASQSPAYVKDPVFYRIIVGGLVLIILACVVGAIVLAIREQATPEVLLSIGSAAVGAVAGIVAQPGARR